MSAIQPILDALLRGNDLGFDTAYPAFSAVMTGKEDTILTTALLVSLRAKGECVDEITAACAAMQDAMIPITGHEDAMDVVGTGGDGQNTLNISTATAFVVAGAGVKVAKHGNKAASSLSGASDVVSALGVKVNRPHAVMDAALRDAGIAFLWAPLFHPGMKNVVPIRQALKISTIFNFLGPLCNPARAKRLLMGVARQDMVQPMVKTLERRGCTKVWGVHGADGLDELSITGTNTITALEDGTIRTFESHPEDAGLPIHRISAIKGSDPDSNAKAILELFAGAPSAYRDMVLYNAAAALMIADKATNLKEGVEIATQSIDSGAAKARLDHLVHLSQA